MESNRRNEKDMTVVIYEVMDNFGVHDTEIEDVDTKSKTRHTGTQVLIFA